MLQYDEDDSETDESVDLRDLLSSTASSSGSRKRTRSFTIDD